MTEPILRVTADSSRAQLLDELRRLEKIVEVLMDRAELGVNSESSDFSLFQTTIMLEDKVRRRTAELEQALKQLDESNAALEQSLQTLHETQKQLVESEKMAAIGHLVAGVAHEINTPVGVGVTGASHLRESTARIGAQVGAGHLSRRALLDYLAEMEEGCELIQFNLGRASELIQRFKQVAANQAAHDKLHFDLGDLVREIAYSLRPSLEAQGVQVAVESDRPLPVFSYSGAIIQIVTNLMMNSLVHGFDGVDQGRICIRLHGEGERVRLVYSDNGCGLDEAIIDHVFEPFYSTRRGAGGTGLGLYICYNLVQELLGGSIECGNAADGGAEFRLELPAEAP